METVLAVIAIALLPFAVAIALLRIAGRRERRREQMVARQVELTDAIHRELGAIAAPVVEPASHGAWRASIALPADHPEAVGALARIAGRVLSREGRTGGRRIRIALLAEPVDEREAA